MPAAMRYLDLIVLALAFPVFLLGDFPLLGYAAGGGVWIVQRVIQSLLARMADRSDEPRTVVGLNALSVLGRGWLVALTILLVGIRNDEVGLGAAVLVITLFTIYFPMNMLARPPRRDRPVREEAASQ